MEWTDAEGVILWLWGDVHESICQSTGNKAEPSSWRAISTVSGRRGWKDRGKRGGSCVKSHQVTNSLGSKLSNSGWHQNNRQHGLTDTHLVHFWHLVCALFLFFSWNPAVSRGGSHVEGRATQVLFPDLQLSSRNIMSFSVATLPLTAAHLLRHRYQNCGPLWSQSACLSVWGCTSYPRVS